MTERKRTIFEDTNSFNFNGNLSHIMKFNSYFKKLGFERVNIGRRFSTNTYYPQITLMVRPEVLLTHDSDAISLNQEFPLTMWNVQRGDVNFELWGKYFSKMNGYSGMNSHKVIKKSKEPIKDMTITFEGKELILGQYLPERNVVLLYINIFNTDLGQENNVYLETCLKIIEDTIKTFDIKKVNVIEKMKLVIVENFKKEINNKIDGLKDNVRYSENEYSTLNRTIVSLMKTIEVNRKELNGLVAFSSNTDEVIKKEIEDVRTLPFVKKAILTSEGVFLDVGKIFIKHREEDIYIGDFYITINPDEIKIFCKNPILDKDNMECHHPHIDRNNTCYGDERRRKINEYLANFELKKLTFYLYLFLKSYTPDDCYNSLSMWVREDVKRRRKKIQIQRDDVNMEFEGDYFSSREDRGDDDDNYDSDDNNDDDNDEDRDDDDNYDEDGNRL